MRSCLFFSSWSGDLRDLHSFPTRRSSDLRSGRPSSTAPTAPAAASCSSSIRSASAAIHGWTTSRKRSEEHTSELQSHVNLVCRLLLEKKKFALPSNTSKHLGIVPHSAYP